MPRSLAVAAALAACAGPATPPPSVPPEDERRAKQYADAAEHYFSTGEHELAFELATRALVVRLAACGVECPDPAASFLQLGDMRRANGQPGWAAQSYARALEILAPFRDTHGAWIRALEERREAACREAKRRSPACR